MDGTVNILLIVLIVVGTCAAAAATWAFVRVGRAAASAEKLAADLHERVGPLADKADELLESASVTVDAANVELLRVDAMVTRAEEAIVRFDSASNTVSDVVRSPGAFISGVAERIRRRNVEKGGSDRVANPGGSRPAAEAQDAGVAGKGGGAATQSREARPEATDGEDATATEVAHESGARAEVGAEADRPEGR